MDHGPLSLSTLLAALLVLAPACAEPEAEAEAEASAGEGEALPPDPEDPCAPGPDPSLEIGQGELIYEPLVEGEMLELIHGPQGGTHTLTGLWAKDIDGHEELVGQLRGYLGDTLVGGSYPYLNFRCKSGEGLQVWGVFLYWEASPEQLHLQTVRIEADVTDAAGEVVTASKEVLIYDPTL